MCYIVAYSVYHYCQFLRTSKLKLQILPQNFGISSESSYSVWQLDKSELYLDSDEN